MPAPGGALASVTGRPPPTIDLWPPSSRKLALIVEASSLESKQQPNTSQAIQEFKAELQREYPMNARGKLNVAFDNGSLITGAPVGLSCNSFIAFVVVALIGMLLSLYMGDIRTTPRHRPR
jgi:hypothetical protein